MAGLPGTGLGGIFYMFLVIWMVARETWLLATGESCRTRWPKIAHLAILTVCIIGALWLEGWLLLWLEGWLLQHAFVLFPGVGGRTLAVMALAPALAAAPFVILAVLLGGIHLVRLLRRRSEAGIAALGVATKE